MKKFLSFILVCMLILSMAAFAEEDLQAQLDAANAKIEELQALVDKYEPYYTSQVAATYGEDGVILVEDILAEYEEMASYYSQYGIDLVAYGMDGQMKQDILTSAVENAVLMEKAAELGLDQLSEEDEASVRETTDSTIQSYYDSYIQYFYADAEEITDEMTQEAKDYWAQNGLDENAIYDSAKQSAILTAIQNYVVKDVAVNEDDVVAEYNNLVASNQADYTSSISTFVNDYSSGSTIAWRPEGVRAVKQVLIKFNDEQASTYSDLQSQLSTLNAELDSVLNPTEETESAEETEAPRTAEEIEADIANVNAQIDALYEELTPEVTEVVEAFNNGTSIEELIEKYNDDPGMTNEPTATTGYAVAADCNNWDPSFAAAAMSIESKGMISEPARGSYGIYIVYYMDDVASGEVGMETIRDSLTESTLNTKLENTYNDQVSDWVAESGVTYYYENLGIAA